MAEKKPKKIWDNCKYIGEVKKSDRTKLKIELVTRDGVKYVNIREWYMRQRDKEWKPGMAGFAIPIHVPIDQKPEFVMQQVMMLVADAINQSNDFPLHDPLGEVWTNG